MHEIDLYQKYLQDRHWENHPTVYAEFFGEYLQSVVFNGLLVDIGCGGGRDVGVFARYGFNVLGIDYSEREVVSARSSFSGLNFQVQNVEDLTFVSGTVGAFFMINVIHYVDQVRAIDGILRSLKSGGLFFVHFNLSIIDRDGVVDYEQDEVEIFDLVSSFVILHRRVFERIDSEPIKHVHKIMELILKKR